MPAAAASPLHSQNESRGGYQTRPSIYARWCACHQSDDGSCFASCNSIGSPLRRRSHWPALVISTDTLPSADVRALAHGDLRRVLRRSGPAEVHVRALDLQLYLAVGQLAVAAGLADNHLGPAGGLRNAVRFSGSSRGIPHNFLTWCGDYRQRNPGASNPPGLSIIPVPILAI